MHNQILLGLTVVYIIALLSSCTKKGEKKEGYTFTTAVHNSLSEPVFLVNGGKYYADERKDSLIFSQDSIRILPDSTYTSSYFICTKNCPPVYYIQSTLPAVPGVLKIIAGVKEKIDTACGFLVSGATNEIFDCTKDIKNYFNNKFWKETKNNKGNVVRREYTVDAVDFSEMR